MKIKTGDTVVVISGKDKGKTGQVLRVLPTKNRVVVADINMRTRHIKGGPQRPGEIVKYEASLDASNVMLVDGKTKKRTRIGYKKTEKGKVRIAKRSGEEIKKSAVASKKATDKSAADKAEEKMVKKVKEGKEGANAKVKEGTSDTSVTSASSNTSKQPFWKKMGFGAEEMGDNAEVDTGSHMQEDHSVPDQIERSSSRSSGRGA